MKEQSKKTVAKKKFFKMVFSRAGIFVILILIQLLVFLGIPYYLKEYATFIYSAMSVMEIVVLVYIINTEGNPAFKMTWMLCVMALPVIGTVFYIYVHLQLETRFVQNRLAALRMETEPYMDQDEKVTEALWASKSANAQLSYYLSHQLGFPTYRNTEVEYFPVGEDKFASMIKELEKAEKFIFMEYFIVEEGIMWDTILEILKRKVNEGVEVRFMYDGMCAFDLLPYSYPKKLQKFGIKCKMSNKIRPFVSTIQNNRDHRKITVIDGKIGFTGGYNLADEYFNITHPYGYWKDTGVRLEGDAVRSLTVMFLEMWNAIKGTDTDYTPYFLQDGAQPHEAGLAGSVADRDVGAAQSDANIAADSASGFVQPYADSPLDGEPVGENVYMGVVKAASEYVYFTTPYLIISDEMSRELCLAAKRGVDVRIVTPGIPDKKLVYRVTRSYYAQLASAGVRIFEYTPGFLHAKQCVSDDVTATVGTINLDYRSLYFHFENGVFLHRCEAVRKVREDFEDIFPVCREVTEQYAKKQSAAMKFGQCVLRLIAPLL